MALKLVCGADFWCNRHCKTSPVVLEGFWDQVWQKFCRKLEKSEYRVANEPLNASGLIPRGICFVFSKASTKGQGSPHKGCVGGAHWEAARKGVPFEGTQEAERSLSDAVTKPYEFLGFGDIHGPKPYKFIRFGDIHGPKPYTFIGFGDIHGPKPYKIYRVW